MYNYYVVKGEINMEHENSDTGLLSDHKKRFLFQMSKAGELHLYESQVFILSQFFVWIRRAYVPILCMCYTLVKKVE